MSIVIDIILVAIVIISIIIGIVRGFADRALGLLSGVASFILAIVFAPALSSFFYERYLFSRLTNFISEKLQALAEGSELKNLLENGSANENFRRLLENLGIDYGTVSGKISDGAAGISESIAEPASRIASYAVAFILIFLASLLAFFLIRLLLKLVIKAPALRKADRIIGAIFGAVLGIAVVWVISIVLKMGLPYLSTLIPEVFPEDLFEKSFVLRIFYDINALKDMFDFKKLRSAGMLFALI